jgi:1-phosphatidylinositol phosphodiesterase
MAPPLTIRNCTSTPLILKNVERFEPAGEKSEAEGFSIASLQANVTNLIQNVTNSDNGPRIPEGAQSFTHQDVDIRVDSFKTQTTDVKATEKFDTEILRLTFEVDGQRYRTDVPSPTKASNVLEPLDRDPRHHFTVIYHPEVSHLAVYSSANLDSWQKELKDETPLSAISMPGTHNSPTCHTALPSVRCQAVDVKTQLENGVRFFDLRLQPETPKDPSKDELILVHSVFPISLTGTKYFRQVVLDVTTEFLDQHPSETVVISFKREGTGDATDQEFGRILKDHYATDPNRWYTEPRIPKLGEVRKKIVVLRRFGQDDSLKKEHNGRGWGLDAENWADNTPNCTHGDVCVQDFYEVLETENIDKKITYCEAHLAEAATTVAQLGDISAAGNAPKQPIFINFLSASNFWKAGCWPDRIAAKINPAVINYLCTKHFENVPSGDGGTGVVICDWVGLDGDWDLVRAIVGQNARLLARE